PPRDLRGLRPHHRVEAGTHDHDTQDARHEPRVGGRDDDRRCRRGAMNAARSTMTDVAVAAGVSLKTVSRVVNAEPGVAPETSDRVHEAIERLGSRCNYVARAPRRGPRFPMAA